MTTLTEVPPTTGRLRAAWTAAHAPVPGVSRWARIAAYAIPFTVLPASLWRIAAVTLHLPIGRGEQGAGDIPSWLPMELYVVLLPADFPLEFHDWQGLLAVVAYAPLLLWGPLLGALTVAYWRRRRARPTAPVAAHRPSR